MDIANAPSRKRVAAFFILVREATGDPLRQDALEQLLPGTEGQVDFERLDQELEK